MHSWTSAEQSRDDEGGEDVAEVHLGGLEGEETWEKSVLEGDGEGEEVCLAL